MVGTESNGCLENMNPDANGGMLNGSERDMTVHRLVSVFGEESRPFMPLVIDICHGHATATGTPIADLEFAVQCSPGGKRKTCNLVIQGSPFLDSTKLAQFQESVGGFDRRCINVVANFVKRSTTYTLSDIASDAEHYMYRPAPTAGGPVRKWHGRARHRDAALKRVRECIPDGLPPLAQMVLESYVTFVDKVPRFSASTKQYFAEGREMLGVTIQGVDKCDAHMIMGLLRGSEGRVKTARAHCPHCVGVIECSAELGDVGSRSLSAESSEREGSETKGVGKRVSEWLVSFKRMLY